MDTKFIGIKKIYNFFYIGNWEITSSDYVFEGWEIFPNGIHFKKLNLKKDDQPIMIINNSEIENFDYLRKDLYKYLKYLFNKCDGQSQIDNSIAFISHTHIFLYPDARHLIEAANKDADSMEFDGLVLYIKDKSITDMFVESSLESLWNIMKDGYFKLISKTTCEILLELIWNRYKKIYEYVSDIYKL